MIVYFVTAKNAATIEDYLATWGRASSGDFHVFPYERMGSRMEMPRGTFIFSDIERLTPEQTELAARVHDVVAATTGCRALNHPARSRRRYDLLRRLRDVGQNAFDARRLSEGRRARRYPVFLRLEGDHDGPRTGLLETEHEVERACVSALMMGYRADDVLLVEWVDTKDATGVYRKYSAFCIGGAIVPRHLIFSRRWVLKMPDLLDEAKLAEERAYLEGNPHQADLRRIFEEARVDYGRIDYSLAPDGRLQVWEINTNPIVMMRPEKYEASHLRAQEWFAAAVAPAFGALDSAGGGSGRFDVALDPHRGGFIRAEVAAPREGTES